jgi:hypothetical protein
MPKSKETVALWDWLTGPRLFSGWPFTHFDAAHRRFLGMIRRVSSAQYRSLGLR